MKITVKEGKAYISTPYNKDFVAKIKQIGGAKWNAESRCWMIPESEIDTARKYMQEVYGETDLPAEGERVTVDVTFLQTEWEVCESISLFGKVVVRAWGRDSGAKVCEDVTLVDGRIGSGGSVKNWRTTIYEGAVLRIRNIPRAALQIENPYHIKVEEVQKDGIDREALMIEREKLMARLAEIEALLK